jgi:hypothetical protein
MTQKRDITDVDASGHLAIAVSMVIFVIITLVLWALIFVQIHRARKQRIAELEVGAEAIDEEVPLEDLLRMGARASKSSSSQSDTEEPLFKVVIHNIARAFKN